ncbi:DUF3231 family protein [Pseudalkalibacillus decolorationis]|uniref:DUF3231 family protein n=1 Tax=Pseudalkalibacillus decolorationis TaxID=163879 RepID=UPI0021477D02|nr:DUF3231 family protein [Pseudalkalibacillus decolorationis]
MEADHNPKLTASEVSSLWATFQTSTMMNCGVKYFLETVEDEEIRSVLEFASDFIGDRIQTITQLFHEEQYPIPVGFTDDDVNTNAPRLFSDIMILQYMMNMGKFSHTGESILYSFSTRDDIAAFYYQCLADAKELANRARKVSLKKGVLVRAPYLPRPHGVDFVNKQSFLTGWFGNRRPLLGIEISNLFYNAERNALGHALTIGFSQVVGSKEVRKYMERGKEISAKHFEVFSSVLQEENLSTANSVASEVTDSTVSPFSDKLMMFHVSVLVASGIAQYGAGISASPRRDLGAMYTRLMAETGKYSEDGANIMIDNGWLEQPPQAADRESLARNE